MLTTRRSRPGPIALARGFLALGALLTSVEGAAHLIALQDDRVRTPVADWLPGALSLPVAGWFLTMAVAAILLLAGLLVAPSSAALALGNALLMTVDLQLYSNHRLLLVLLCVWFCFAGSDRAWAPGARRRRNRLGATVPWWPQLLLVATVSSCYLFAGLSKLNPVFLSGDVIADFAPTWFPTQLAAWATPPTEIAIALGLWWRRTRWVAILLGVGLHASITVLMGAPMVFGAFALLCMTAYPLAGREGLLPAVRASESGASGAGGGAPAVQGLPSGT